MATVVHHDHNTLIYLFACHQFGRLYYSVDTLLKAPEISKLHATIEWQEPHWVLRDLSSNGTWLNQQKLPPAQEVVLKPNDTIHFGRVDGESITVIDLNPPKDFLQAENTDSANHNLDSQMGLSEASLPEAGLKKLQDSSIIPLDDYMLLPNEANPEVVIFHDRNLHQWFVEYSQDNHAPPIRMGDEERIKINQVQWVFRQNRVIENTQEINKNAPCISDLSFQFNVSLDEEKVELQFNFLNNQYDLKIRTHHYLALLLARYRHSDANKGLDDSSCGWVYTEQLASEIGVDVSHLNIQIHRARKQFADLASYVIDSDHFIERRPGEIRFGGSHFKIYKGNHLEINH